MRLPLVLLLLLLTSCGENRLDRRLAEQKLLRVEQGLDEGRYRVVEALLSDLAESEDFRVARRVRFLRGNLSFAQAEQEAGQAQSSFGKAEDWKKAIRLARLAQRHWKSARGESPDWPAARRNIERAERWIDALLEAADDAGIELDPGDFTQETPPEPPPEPEGEQEEAPPMPPPPTPERIDSLLERLQEQEERQRSERRAVPGMDVPEVERDW